MTPRNMLFVAAAGLIGLVWSAQHSFAAGDAAEGETLFKHKCGVCHKIGPGATNFVGPDLNGLNGRPIASEPGYDYSDADKAKKATGWTWTEANFKTYITNPQGTIPGTKMVFPGLPKDSDRDNIWAYISQFKADGSK
jgi:cytochrome c